MPTETAAKATSQAATDTADAQGADAGATSLDFNDPIDTPANEAAPQEEVVEDDPVQTEAPVAEEESTDAPSETEPEAEVQAEADEEVRTQEESAEGEEATSPEPEVDFWDRAADELSISKGEDGKFYIVDDEVGGDRVVYRGDTPQEAYESLKHGVRKKEEYIHSLSDRAQKLEQQLQEAKEQLGDREYELQYFRDQVSETELDRAFIGRQMGEQNEAFAGITTLSDIQNMVDEEQREEAFEALSEAKAELKRQKELRDERRQKQKNQFTKRHEEAVDFYNTRINAKAFDATNVEEQGELKRFLTKDSGFTNEKGEPANLAEAIYILRRDTSEEVANTFVEGLKAKFWNNYRPGTTTYKKPKPTTPKQKEAPVPKEEKPTTASNGERVIKRPASGQAGAPQVNGSQNLSAIERLKAGAAAQKLG